MAFTTDSPYFRAIQDLTAKRLNPNNSDDFDRVKWFCRMVPNATGNEFVFLAALNSVYEYVHLHAVGREFLDSDLHGLFTTAVGAITEYKNLYPSR